jgi:uncharacterized protein
MGELPNAEDNFLTLARPDAKSGYTVCRLRKADDRKFITPKNCFMKRVFVVAALLAAAIAHAQKNYKVVLDLTSGDSLSQQTAIRWVGEIVKAEPTAEVEVVMFGKGLPLAIKDKSAVASQVMSLASNKNVAFKVCAVAMQNQNIDKTQLLPGVQTVPDGIYEVISKEQQGWGYIKVAH